MEEKNQKGENLSTRALFNGSFRAVEGKERTFRLSFSSEEPYERWYGTEILDHAGGAVDLSRLNTIGVLLFNHDRDEIIGRVDSAWVENGRGEAEVTFDTDEQAEKIYRKVQNGTLKGVSVGYLVNVWEEVAANKQSADGRFTGPCSVARKWTPLEISIVSVPADPTVGVGREEGAGDMALYETCLRQLQYNTNVRKIVRREKR